MRMLIVSLLLCVSAQAAELRDVVVDRQDGVYSLESEVWFDSDVASLYAVFLNYDLAQEFSGFVVESRNLDPDEDGQRRFYIRNHGCVWFVCRSFERTGVVEHEPHIYINSTADAESSDFHLSRETWTFAPEDEGTVVIYEFTFKPKFWLPPLIGPYVLQRKLENDAGRALNRIEALAQGKRP
jgi:hypothetical protein